MTLEILLYVEILLMNIMLALMDLKQRILFIYLKMRIWIQIELPFHSQIICFHHKIIYIILLMVR